MKRRLVFILILIALQSCCAIKRRWRSSEAAYDKYMIEQCMRINKDRGMTDEELRKYCDPNWKPCPNGSTNPSCQ